MRFTLDVIVLVCFQPLACLSSSQASGTEALCAEQSSFGYDFEAVDMRKPNRVVEVLPRALEEIQMRMISPLHALSCTEVRGCKCCQASWTSGCLAAGCGCAGIRSRARQQLASRNTTASAAGCWMSSWPEGRQPTATTAWAQLCFGHDTFPQALADAAAPCLRKNPWCNALPEDTLSAHRGTTVRSAAQGGDWGLHPGRFCNHCPCAVLHIVLHSREPSPTARHPGRARGSWSAVSRPQGTSPGPT